MHAILLTLTNLELIMQVFLPFATQNHSFGAHSLFYFLLCSLPAHLARSSLSLSLSHSLGRFCCNTMYNSPVGTLESQVGGAGEGVPGRLNIAALSVQNSA